MRDHFSVLVEGRPAPQGSKSYKGNGRFVEASKYLPAWRSAIVEACKHEFVESQCVEMFTGPVRLEVTFFIDRPQRPKAEFPITPPDLDKLVRGVCDSLTQAKVWVDDSLVVSLRADEVYTGSKTYPVSGARITVTAL